MPGHKLKRFPNARATSTKVPDSSHQHIQHTRQFTIHLTYTHSHSLSHTHTHTHTLKHTTHTPREVPAKVARRYQHNTFRPTMQA